MADGSLQVNSSAVPASGISGQLMTVPEHVVSRPESVQAYFYAWRYSGRVRLRMFLLGVTLWLGVFVFDWLQGKTGAVDPTAWTLGLFIFLPVYSAIRTPQLPRTWRVGDTALVLQIGRQTIEMPWRTISYATVAGKFVIVGRSNPNFMYIPVRAFAESTQVEQLFNVCGARLHAAGPAPADGADAADD